jgi:hypothetical protein
LLPAGANVALPSVCHPWSAGRCSGPVADGAVFVVLMDEYYTACLS